MSSNLWTIVYLMVTFLLFFFLRKLVTDLEIAEVCGPCWSMARMISIGQSSPQLPRNWLWAYLLINSATSCFKAKIGGNIRVCLPISWCSTGCSTGSTPCWSSWDLMTNIWSSPTVANTNTGAMVRDVAGFVVCQETETVSDAMVVHRLVLIGLDS